MEKSIRILTVDDNEFDRETICRALSGSNLDVELSEAETPEQASALLSNNKFDCMLLDYLMPTVNGLEFLKAMEHTRQHPAVVMLTGMGNERIAVEAMKSGVHEYINKSDMSTETITNAVINAMNARQDRRDEKNRQSELLQMSFYDQLTGLANRNLLMNRLNEHVKRSRRQHSRFSIMLMDLDGFKSVNDTWGHEAGDRLLVEISSRLVGVSRESDTVSRLGGDEFVILLSDTKDSASVPVVARKILESVEQPVDIEKGSVNVGASIGIAMYPDHGKDIYTLLRNADKAMYQAKQSRRGYLVYSANDADERINRISGDLPDILNEDSMVLHYQPKVSLQTGQPGGIEVLLRWRHPVLGLLLPQEFIPVAEKSILIRDLSYTLIDRAFAQYASWVSAGNSLPMSINLSSKLLSDQGLPQTIESIRRSHHIDSSRITLEITESLLFCESRNACKVLEKLVADGFRISIDDFGTGFSALSCLRDFPISEIKIDGSFVRSVQADERNRHIIEAIIGLARAFKATTVAEGIESIEVWKQMQDMGCDYGQGFYIGRPANACDFIAWQHRWNSETGGKARAG